jgi:hypothetical protein
MKLASTASIKENLHMQQLLPLIFSLGFLSGCAGIGSQSSQSSSLNQKMAACMAATKQSNLLAIEVPAANNFISNKMAAATLRMGGSNTVNTLVEVLSQPTRLPLAVIGANDEVTAATLELALRKLAPGVNRSKQPLCFAGDPQYEAQLKAAAEAVGVLLLMAPNS